MKNLKKKFGKFALNQEQMKKNQGGFNICICQEIIHTCNRGGFYVKQPEGCEAECCNGWEPA